MNAKYTHVAELADARAALSDDAADLTLMHEPPDVDELVVVVVGAPRRCSCRLRERGLRRRRGRAPLVRVALLLPLLLNGTAKYTNSKPVDI